MTGFHWETRAGRDWQVLEDELQPDRLRMGLLMDYGRIDEGPGHLGELALLAAALRAELQRPIELGGGEVSVPEVEVTPGLAWTAIDIRGRRKAVLVTWDRLGELLARPRLTTTAVPLPVNSRRWCENLAVYTGINTETLSGVSLHATPRPADAEALLARIAPSACHVRHLFYTDDPYVIGAGWSGEATYGTAPPHPPRRVDRRPALVSCTDPNVLLSVPAPVTLAGMIGIHTLAQRISGVLREMRWEGGLGVEVILIRDVQLATFFVTAPGLSGEGRRRVIDQILQPGLPLPDTVVDEALEQPDSLDLLLLARVRRLWGLDERRPLGSPAVHRGAAPGVDSVPPGIESMDLDAEWEAFMTSRGHDEGAESAAPTLREGTADEAKPTPTVVRRVVDEMLASVHVVLSDETADLAAQRSLANREEPDHHCGHRIVLARADRSGEFPLDMTHPHVVEWGERTLAVSWYEWNRVGGAWRPERLLFRVWIDAGTIGVAARRDDSILLIDDRLGIVCLPWTQVASHPEIKAFLEHHGLARVPWYTFGR